MELRSHGPSIVQLSDLPTDGNAVTGDRRHLYFRIVDYAEGETVTSNSLFTWTYFPPPLEAEAQSTD